MTFPEFMWDFDVVMMSLLVIGVPVCFAIGEIIEFINDINEG